MVDPDIGFAEMLYGTDLQIFKLTFQYVATLQSGLFVEILIKGAFEMLSLVLVIEQFPNNMSSKSDYFVPLICVVES